MNLILHQLRTDLWHFRWYLALLWLCFAVDAWIMGHGLPAAQGLNQFGLLPLFLEILVGAGLIRALIHADALTGDGAGWLTRPVRRTHLFWAKSLFIVLFLLLPGLLSQAVSWWMLGYDVRLGLCGAGQWLLFAGLLVLAVLALAAVTSSAAQFMLWVGVLAGGMVGWCFLLSLLGRHNGELGVPEWQQPSLITSRIVAGVLWLMFLLGIAWLAQALKRRRTWALVAIAVGLMSFPMFINKWGWNFLKPKLPTAALEVSVRQQDSPVVPTGGRLFEELYTTNLPPKHVAVSLGDFNFSWYPDPATGTNATGVKLEPVMRQSASPGQLHATPADSPQRGEYLRLIHGFFPAETLWFSGDYSYSYGSASGMGDKFSDRKLARLPGSLAGDLNYDVFAVREVADLPLRQGRANIAPGQNVRIWSVSFGSGQLRMLLEETGPLLLLDNHPETAEILFHNFWGSRCTYVLHNPVTGEAIVVGDRTAPATRFFLPGVHGTIYRLGLSYPALRERFAGTTGEEWMAQARLRVFLPVYQGSGKARFAAEHFVYNPAESSKATNELAQVILPANATQAQVDRYLDNLFTALPEYPSDKVRKLFAQKIAALGSTNLPVLLARLPLGTRLEKRFGLINAISKVATRDLIPDLRASLPRCPALAGVFEKNHWEADVRDLLPALAHGRQPLPSSVLKLLAGTHDPATYEDLRWHFLRLTEDQGGVLAALKDCPGFDFDGLVGEAWQRSLLQLGGGIELTPYAAKLGLPDALPKALMSAERERNQVVLDELAAITGCPVTGTNTLTWLNENLTRLQYDPAQKRYVVR